MKNLFVIFTLAITLLLSSTLYASEYDTGIYIAGRGGILTETEGTSDNKALGTALGYDFGVIRMEGEYFFRGDFDINGVNNVHTQSIMMNAYAEWENSYLPISPFVMAGVGIGFVDTSVTKENAGFAYSLGAGANLHLMQGFTIEAMYRFTEIGSSFMLDNVEKSSFKVQEVIVGLRYTF